MRRIFTVLGLCFHIIVYAQFSQQHILSVREITVLTSLLEELHGKEGTCSNLKIERAFLSEFQEKGDYGPMYYGEKMKINKYGYLLTYKYDKIDYTVDKSQGHYMSNDWHSDERLFLPDDKSAKYRFYKCQFGGIPPSFGFAHRKGKWNKTLGKIYVVLRKYR